MRKNYLSSQFISKINEDGTLNVESLIILACAIFIASIGLNTNSTATIIGAMLISPLMGPLLAIGMGLAIYNTGILKRGIISLLIEVAISLLASAIYFYFSPLSYASQEIISRTTPTIWDVLVAFFGGTAGIIGARKRGATNIVAGVAIATALMPPLCTVGYSIARRNLKYFVGSSYLFLINCVFIILTAFLGVKIMKWLSHSVGQPSISLFRKPSLKEVAIISFVILLIIPSFLSAKHMVSNSMVNQNVQSLVSNEFGDVNLISENVDTGKKTINLTVSGEKISTKKIQDIQTDLDKYNLNGYSLNVTQVAQVDADTKYQLTRQVNNIINRRQQEQKRENERKQEEQEKQNNKIKKMSSDIRTVTVTTDKSNKKIILIELKKKMNKENQEKLNDKIKNKYHNIQQVKFVYAN